MDLISKLQNQRNSEKVRQALGQVLRQSYSGLEDQPFPQRLTDLLKRLENEDEPHAH